MFDLQRSRQNHSASAFRYLMLVVLTAGFGFGCAGGGPAADSASEPAAAPAAAAETISYDVAILDVLGRTEDDHYRDGGMRPLDVYAFFGVEPGMVVGDLATSRMYNAHILGQIVGSEGNVYAVLGLGDTLREGAMERAQGIYDSRNVEGSMANVEVIGTLEDIPDNSLDMLITVRNYHDFGEREARMANTARMLRVLKPGGILGAIDAHTDKSDERDEPVHRLNEDLAREEIIESGFEFLEASDLLYNAEDTFDFDGREGDDTPDDPSDDAPIHRYFIQRWVLKFQKPVH